MLSPTVGRAWHGLRTLIEELPALRSRRELAAQRAEHRSALARIPGLREHAEGDEVGRPLLAARTLSHLSHNFLLQKPLFEALADFVHGATSGTDLTLIVPDLAVLDRESAGLLRTLFRKYPETAPSLIAGFDPDRETPEPDDDGLIWELRNEEVWRVVMGFLSLPGAESRDLPRNSDDPPPSTGPHGALRNPHPDPAKAVEAVKAAFESFAFETALRQGLALARGKAALSRRQRAEVHGRIALSAHNRQFRSLGNRRLAEFLCEHLTIALEAEDRPAERSALCYRLAVAYGRRLKERTAGLDWSERAIEEARRAELPAADSAILEAWGRNIKAFMLTGFGRLDEAAKECELAYRRLDAALSGEAAPLQSQRAAVRETVFSRSILADNLGAIFQMAGDAERTREWKTVSDGHNRDVPEVERYEARFWIATYRRRFRLDAARERARRGLDAARREQDALREYRYGVELADLSYRLRDAQGALTAFKDAEDLHARLGSPSFLRPVRLAPAAAASRAGRHEEALKRIDAALVELPPDRSVARAQALALRGLCLARVGQAESAETAIDEAIELAVAVGERDLLLAVAVTAGRACRLLGRDGDAREAYLQAVEISAEQDEASGAPPAGLELAARLGHLENSDPPDAGSAGRCLELFDTALEDAETWWLVPRLVTQLERALPGDPRAQAALERLRWIIAQGSRASDFRHPR